MAGETASIRARSIEPSGFSANVTKASARNSRSVQRATNVSCCQCSSVPVSAGVFVKRIDSLPPASSIWMSPYHWSV